MLRGQSIFCRLSVSKIPFERVDVGPSGTCKITGETHGFSFVRYLVGTRFHLYQQALHNHCRRIGCAIARSIMDHQGYRIFPLFHVDMIWCHPFARRGIVGIPEIPCVRYYP